MADKAADNRVLLSLGGAAYRLALHVSGSAEMAEDAVQEAYLAALRQMSASSPPDELRPWFLKVVANAARKQMRGEAAIKRREAAAMRDEDRGAEGLDPELVARLRRALAELDEKYRLPVALCCEEGLSHREAAAVLSVPERTLSRYVESGLDLLRKAMAGAGYAAAPAALAAALAGSAPPVPNGLAVAIEKLMGGGAVVKGTGAAAAAGLKGGIAMKILVGAVLAGALAGGITLAVPNKGAGPVLPAAAEAGPKPAGKTDAAPAGDVPQVVLDESASRWVIDRFAGNSTAGPQFLQGPAVQAGGLGTSQVAPASDGSVFLSAGLDCKWAPNRIAQVDPDGTLRLVAGGGSSLAAGPAGMALIRAESLCYSTAEKSLYFVHRTIPCVRRLYEKDGQWLVETVAGDPEKSGSTDGAGKAALFAEPRSLAITGTGTVYVLDGTSVLRKIDKGQVSTVVQWKGNKDIVDGPLATASMAVTKMSGDICLGDNDNTLYVADHWHFAARRVDLKAGTVTTVAGMPKPAEWRPEKQTAVEKRYNRNSDGPAMTHAIFNSGCAWTCWDPVHKALWLGGPDEDRLRWLKDGVVKTPLPFKRLNQWRENGTGLKPEETSLCWTHVNAVDQQGRAYINGASSKTGIWRATLQGGAQ